MATNVEVVATNNVHYATTARRPLCSALAAVRAGRSLDEMDGWLPAGPFAHLRSPPRAAPPVRPLARRGGAHRRHRDATVPSTCGSRRRNLPDYPVPDGYTEMSWLRELVRTRRGGLLPAGAQPSRAGDAPDRARARGGRRARFPRLLPVAARHRASSAARTTSTARGGGAPRTARSVTRSVSPRPTRSRSACCSNASCHPSATARPTSTSTSSTSGARR